MSSASRFSLVRGNNRNLLRGNTFGTGQLLAHALRKSGAGPCWHWRQRDHTEFRPQASEVLEVARSRSLGEIVRYQTYTPGADAEGDRTLSLFQGKKPISKQSGW